TTEDVTRPELSCPGEITVDADPNACTGTVTDLTSQITATDNCDAGNTLNISQLPVAGTTFTASTQNVTVFAEDAANNISQCNVTFRKRDVTPPTVVCPGDQQLTVNANCLAVLPDFMAGAGMDACGGVSIVQEPGPGTNLSNDVTVTLTVTDNAGLVSTCDFFVEVIDEMPPTISCPEGQTISVDGNCSVPLPDYTSQAAAQDNCDPRKGPVTISQSPAPGTMYSGDGTTIAVTLTATDASNNISSCNFDVVLEDMTEPSLTCPVSPQVQMLDVNCQAIIPDFREQASATSMCMMEDLTLSQLSAPGTVVSGEQIVEITITAADPNGNSVSCAFDFQTVDTSDPVLVCPENRTENVDGSCEFNLPDYRSLATASDNCSAPAPAPNLLTITQSSEVSVSGHGTITTVMLTATDAAGNASSCSFTVTLADVTPPSLSCPADQIEEVDGDCSFRIPDYTAQVTTTDNCDASPEISLAQQPSPGTEVNGDGSVTIITITATDAAGNTTTCSFKLLLEDNSPPTINCPPSEVLA
ncbi:MAG: HYR domain-containing protein, partial [Bacteroidota bacterium]